MIQEIRIKNFLSFRDEVVLNFTASDDRFADDCQVVTDGLLDLVGDLIRKDSVWFTEKDRSGATVLYKLSDFRGVNRLSSIREAYRNKRFGATIGDGK